MLWGSAPLIIDRRGCVMGSYILAHDLGTSGNKASLPDTTGALGRKRAIEYPTYYPDENWVEQDAEDWWKAVCVSTKQLMEKANISAKEIIAVSFSAQMMGVPTGRPRRKSTFQYDYLGGHAFCSTGKIFDRPWGMERVYRITGHRASVILGGEASVDADNCPKFMGRIKMLHAKDYIIHKLTGNFVTDYSDASGTNLLDLEKKVWSKEILQRGGNPGRAFTDLHASTDIAGGITASAAGNRSAGRDACGDRRRDGSCAAVGAGVVRKGKLIM